MTANLLFVIAGIVVANALARLAGLAARLSLIVSIALGMAFASGSLLHPFILSEPQSDLSAVSAPDTPAPAARPTLSPPKIATLSNSNNSGLGAIDSVVVSRDRSAAYVSGWIANRITLGPADRIIVLIDGRARFDATAAYGQYRPDVAQALGSSAAERTGFSGFRVPLRGLSKGRHLIGCAALATGDSYDALPVTRAIVL